MVVKTWNAETKEWKSGLLQQQQQQDLPHTSNYTKRKGKGKVICVSVDPFVLWVVGFFLKNYFILSGLLKEKADKLAISLTGLRSKEEG